GSADRAGVYLAASGSVFMPSFKRDAAGTLRGVVFESDGAGVSAVDVTGATLWHITLKNIGIVPTFDWDGDGVPDVFVAERIDAVENVTCVDTSGNPTSEVEAAPSTMLHFRSGKDGSLLLSFGALPDFCWQQSPTVHSFYPQWTAAATIASEAEH